MTCEIAPDRRLAPICPAVVAPRCLDTIGEHAPRATIAYDTIDLHSPATRTSSGSGYDGHDVSARSCSTPVYGQSRKRAVAES